MSDIKVLVCGSYQSAFQKKLLLRLKKEKKEVFVLTNDSVSERKPAAVLQEYRFPYQSGSIVNIMSSISPDAVIFCAACDETYHNGEKMGSSVELVAGLMNVLTCAADAKVKRFIYLSSVDVFHGSSETAWTENTKPAPLSKWEKALVQGEQLCFTTARSDAMEISVLRVPHIYGVYQDCVLRGVCADYLENFRENLPIRLHQNRMHELMYVDDVIEAVYRVLHVESAMLLRLYHIAPVRAVSERELYDILCEVSASCPKRIGETQEQAEELLLQKKFVSTTQDSLGFSEKYSLETGMQMSYKQYAAMNRKRKKQETEAVSDENKKLFRPIFETIAAFVVVQLFILCTEEAAFHAAIDVYLIYTVVVAVILGAMPATLAVGLSIFGKYRAFFAAGNALDIFSDYENYLWILQIFTLSVLTAYVRDHYTRLSGELKRENKYLKEELSSIKAINQSNVEVKEVFEERLENYKDSYAKVYEIVSRLDELEANAILFQAASVVAEIMKSDAVAIYTYEEQSDFCRLMVSTSQMAREKGKSLRLSDYAELKECLQRKKIYMNRTFQEQMPMYAVAAFRGDCMEVVTMIWQVELKDVNLYQSNLLSMLGKLMESSMSRAIQYMDSIKHETYMPGTNIMEAAPFQKMLDLYCAGEAKGLLEYSLLRVVAEGSLDIYQKLQIVTRTTDYNGFDQNGTVYVLLTNSNATDSEVVRARFQNCGIEAVLLQKQTGKTAKEVFSDVVF